MIADGRGEAERDLAHRGDVGAADPVLHRPAGGRAERQEADLDVGADEFFPGEGLQPRLHPVAGLEIPVDDDDLADVRARHQHVEGEHEADRALADVG